VRSVCAQPVCPSAKCQARLSWWGVGDGVVQGTTVDPSLVDTGGGQKLGKDGQLCVGGGAGPVVPLHVESTTGRVHDHSIFCLFLTYQLPSFASPIW